MVEATEVNTSDPLTSGSLLSWKLESTKHYVTSLLKKHINNKTIDM